MYVDTVLINGKIFSFEESDNIQKTAVAIKDGKSLQWEIMMRLKILFQRKRRL